MEPYVYGGLGLLVLWLLFGRKGSKKPALVTDEKMPIPEGPRVVGPHDLVIPATLLLERGRMEFEKDMMKAMQRAARGGTEGAARAAEEDETPSQLPPN